MIAASEGSRRFVVVETKPEQPPEGRLIEAALENTTPKLTQKRAAQLARISDARWRQLVSGYVSVGAGHYAPVRAPAKTLARMARVVGVTAEQLADVGREDAATEVLKMADEERNTLPVGTGTDPLDLTTLSEEELVVVRATILAMRQARGEHGERHGD